mgnify:CR=1 FL=1
MDVDTALGVLGLEPDADARAIKRAYHKLLKRHKPDSDPEGFRRLREAYECLTDDAPRSTPPDPQWTSPRPVTQRTLNAVAVHHALDEGRFADAHAMVIDARWADALLDDADGSYAEATYRMGLAAILDHRPAYEAIAAAYPDCFSPNDRRLQVLLAVGREWEHLRSTARLPPQFHAFVAKSFIVDPQPRIALARGLARWFWNDRASAMRGILTLLTQYPSVASVLYDEVRALDDAISPDMPLPLPPQPTPAARLRVPTLWTPLVLVVAALLIAVFSEGNVAARTFIPVLLVGGGLGLIGRPLSNASFRARLLSSCLAHDQPPATLGTNLGPFRLLREGLQNDALLEYGFRIGRLGRLGLDDPSPAQETVAP